MQKADRMAASTVYSMVVMLERKLAALKVAPMECLRVDHLVNLMDCQMVEQ